MTDECRISELTTALATAQVRIAELETLTIEMTHVHQQTKDILCARIRELEQLCQPIVDERNDSEEIRT